MRLLAACTMGAGCTRHGNRVRGGAAQVSEQARELLSSRAAVSFETAKFMLDLNKVLKGPLPGYSRYSIPQCVDARRLGVLWVPEALVGLSQIRVAAPCIASHPLDQPSAGAQRCGRGEPSPSRADGGGGRAQSRCTAMWQG